MPLIWRHFKSHRSLLFRLSHLLQLEPTTQDRSLIQALQLIQDSENLHREWIDEHVDLSFASDRWVKIVRRPTSEGPPTNRRYLEVCVFSYLASELRSGDLCVQGSESFADYRKQLLPWEECLQRLPAYCEKVGLPTTAKEFVASLKSQLEETAQQLDDKFPSLSRGCVDQRCRRAGTAAGDGTGHPAFSHLATDGAYAAYASQARAGHYGQH